MAQPQAPKYPEAPPPSYPGEPSLNYPNQVPVAAGWGPYPPPPPLHPEPHAQYYYGSTNLSSFITVQPVQYTTTPMNTHLSTTRVVIVGSGCSYCQIGTLYDYFDCFAILLAILFFPLGIICCLAMRRKRCSNCGATF